MMRRALLVLGLVASVRSSHADLRIGIDDVVDHESVLSPDGAFIAMANERSVRLLDTTTGRAIATRSDLRCRVQTDNCELFLAMARDGKRLAVYIRPDHRLHVLDLPSAKTAWTAPLDEFATMQFLDDGRLVVGLSDTTVAFSMKGARSAFAPRVLFNLSRDGAQAMVIGDKTSLYDVKTGALTGVPGGLDAYDIQIVGADRYIGRTRAPESKAITWKKGDQRTVTLASSALGIGVPAPYDRVYVQTKTGLRVFSLDGKELAHVPWFVDDANLSSDRVVRRGDQVLVNHRGCVLRFDNTSALAKGSVMCAHRPSLLWFSGATVVVVPWTMTSVAMTYDAKTGELLSVAPFADPEYTAHNRARSSSAVTAKEVLDQIEVTDVKTKKATTFPCAEGSGSAAVSEDGRLLACEVENAVVVYDVRTKRLVKKHRVSDPDTYVLSPDGKRLAIGKGSLVIVDL